MSVNLAGELSQKTGKICLSTWQVSYLRKQDKICLSTWQVNYLRKQVKYVCQLGRWVISATLSRFFMDNHKLKESGLREKYTTDQEIILCLK
jgi:hypothetical protein